MESEQRGRGRPSVPDAVVRQTIVAAAQRLLSSGGAAAMTMERVASEAGIAKKTLYRFASDRAALIGMLVGSWIEPIFPGFEADLGDEDATAALTRFLGAIARVALSPEAISLYRMLASDADLRDKFLPAYNENGIERSRAELARWLSRKAAAGELGLPIGAERAADLLLSAAIAEPLRQITLGLIDPLPAWDIAPRIADAVRLFTHGRTGAPAAGR
jgi:AcrR family transcriptional regulator